MNKIKKSILPIIVLLFSTTNLFADIGNRGRWDSSGSTSDSEIIIPIVILIAIGGLFLYAYIPHLMKNGFDDKESNKIGCWSFIAVIGGLLLLVAMCSH